MKFFIIKNCDLFLEYEFGDQKVVLNAIVAYSEEIKLFPRDFFSWFILILV